MLLVCCRGVPSWEAVDTDLKLRYPGVQMIEQTELEGLLVADRSDLSPVIIDARARSEYAVSHLPGARSLPVDTAEKGAIEPVLRDLRGRPVVVYCSVGYRSAHLAELLLEKGVTSVQNLRGGIFRWAEGGRPLESDAGKRVTVVHPYDRTWGVMLRADLHAPID